MWPLWNSSSKKDKGISLFYLELNSKERFMKSPPLVKWETDLQTSYSEKQWQSVILYNYAFLKCVNHWEMDRVIHPRRYLTPYYTAKFLRGGDNICWRGCGMVGTLFQMLWSCLLIWSYWNSVFRLAEVSGAWVKTNVEQAILSIIVDNYPPQLRPIVVNILASAHLMVLKKWKSSVLPNITEVKCHIHVIFYYECLMAYRDGSQLKLYQRWDPWLSYKSRLQKV